MAIDQFRIVTGTAEAADGSADQAVIASPGAGNKLRLISVVVAVTVVAVGGSGEVALEDGANGTRLFEADADALGVYRHYFGEDGYPLTSATALNLTVDGAITTQATARCTAVAKIIS